MNKQASVSTLESRMSPAPPGPQQPDLHFESSCSFLKQLLASKRVFFSLILHSPKTFKLGSVFSSRIHFGPPRVDTSFHRVCFLFFFCCILRSHDIHVSNRLLISLMSQLHLQHRELIPSRSDVVSGCWLWFQWSTVGRLRRWGGGVKRSNGTDEADTNHVFAQSQDHRQNSKVRIEPSALLIPAVAARWPINLLLALLFHFLALVQHQLCLMLLQVFISFSACNGGSCQRLHLLLKSGC